MFIALQKKLKKLNFVITQRNGELLYINYLNFVHKITFHKWPSFSCTNIRYYANFVHLSFNCICYVLILWVLHINCLSLYYRHNKVSKFQLCIVLSCQKKKKNWMKYTSNKQRNKLLLPTAVQKVKIVHFVHSTVDLSCFSQFIQWPFHIARHSTVVNSGLCYPRITQYSVTIAKKNQTNKQQQWITLNLQPQK